MLVNDVDNVSKKKRKLFSPSASIKSELNDNDYTTSENVVGADPEAQDEESFEEISKQYKKFCNSPKYSLDSEELYCICRQPDHGGEMMISCDGCNEWFHFKCMRINEKCSKLILKFFCKFCRWKGVGYTKWKRKCRLNSCWEPIRSDSKSKYCCDEHGIIFMRQYLWDRSNKEDTLSMHQVKSILESCNYRSDSCHALYSLGREFPKLPQAVEAGKNCFQNSELPVDVRNRLLLNDKHLKSLDNQMNYYNLKIAYLHKAKEAQKMINESVLQFLKNDDENLEKENIKKKVKNNKSRTFELCLYDRKIIYDDPSALSLQTEMERYINCENLYEKSKHLIQNILDFLGKDLSDDSWLDGTICVHERKKCLRHSGWWTLIYDETLKKYNELSHTLKKIVEERENIIRDYSIMIYENT